MVFKISSVFDKKSSSSNKFLIRAKCDGTANVWTGQIYSEILYGLNVVAASTHYSDSACTS